MHQTQDSARRDGEMRRLGWGIALLVAILFLAPILAKCAGLLHGTRKVPWTIRPSGPR